MDADGLPDKFEINWFHTDNNNRSLGIGSTYELIASDVGKNIKVFVEYEDMGGGKESIETASWPATGTIVDSNNEPTVANEIPDQEAVAGTSFSYQVPADTFTDADDDTLTYTANKADDASMLPTWLSFDAATRTFSGTPATTDLGTDSVQVTADDSNGGTANDIFDILVVPALGVTFEDSITSDLAEGNSLDVPVLLSGAPGREVTITLSAEPSRGLSSSDYSVSSLSLTFGASETRKVVTVTATDDSEVDPGERLLLALPAPADLPTGIQLSSGDLKIINIVDNDFQYQASHADGTTLSVNEQAGTLTATVRVEAPDTSKIELGVINENVVLSVSTADGTATAGQDYTLLSQTLTFAPADFAAQHSGCPPPSPNFCARADKTVTVAITDDTAYEGATAETFTLTLSHETDQRVTYPSPAGETATVSIADDERPALTFTVAPTTILENGGTATVTLATTDGTGITADTAIALSLAGTATKGTDYTISSESLTLTAGQSSVTATITATMDAASDDNETVVVTASSGGTAIGTAQTVTITETLPALSIAVNPASIAEAAGTSTVTVSTGTPFTADQTIALTLGGTATEISDYTIGSTSLTLTAGETSVTTTVTAVQDTIDEPDETVIVSASNGGTAIGSATVTITDDDANSVPTVANAIPDQTATAGTAFRYQFPTNTFNDTDTGDTLSYMATKGDDTDLPAWLIFNATTRTFTGTPAAGDVGTLAVKVTATDTGSATVSNEFNIVVRPAAPAGFTAEAGDGRVRLSWTEPRPRVVHEYRYAAGASVPANAAWTSIGFSDQSTVLISGLTNGTAHAFEVRVVGSGGVGPGAAAAVSATPSVAACSAPNLGGRRSVWSATLTVGRTTFSSGAINAGYNNRQGATPYGSLSPSADFSIGGTSYTIALLETVVRLGNRRQMFLELAGSGTFPDAVRTALQFHWCSDSSGLEAPVPDFRITDDNRADWSLHTTREVALSLPANNDATGTPTVTGTAQAGETLTAGMGNITDADGLPATFPGDYAFQWVRVDADGTSNATDITNATANTYTLTAADVGKRVRVRVSFFDVLGGDEEIPGALSGEVVSAPPTNATPTVANEIPDQTAEAGTEFSYEVPANTFDDTDTGDTLTYSATKPDDSTLPTWLTFTAGTRTFAGTPTASDAGTLVVKVTATDTGSATVSNEFNIVVIPAAPAGFTAEAGDGRVRLSWTEPRPRVVHEYRYAAGASVPANAAWTSIGFSDQSTVLISGLTNGTAHAFEVRVVGSGGVGPGAAAAVSATPSVAVCSAPDIGTRREVWSATLTVGPTTFSSDAIYAGYENRQGNTPYGSLSPTADFSIGGTSYTIASLETVVTNSNRRDIFLELVDSRTFPEAVRAALQLHWCGDSSRLDILNQDYRVTDDNDADWSIHTTREVALSLPANNDAAGAPTVTGTAQAGQTLTAGMGDIADADGLPATFPGDYAFQWVRVDADGTSNATDITNATANAYTLTAADVGKRVRVRVSFFDVLGGDEEIPGALSGEVVSAPPTNATPTVANEIPDQTAEAGTEFSYEVPANTFDDTDTSDTLSYMATKADDTDLPTWLSFDAATRTFTGTPAAADTGTVSVKVTATDTSSASVSDEFDIMVIPTAPAGLRAETGDGRVRLSWTEPTPQVDHAYRYAAGASVPPATAWTAVGNIEKATALISGLTNGTAHAFEVRVVGSGGVGPGAAATISATPSVAACSAPSLGGRRSVWSATLTVGRTDFGISYSAGYNHRQGSTPYGSLSPSVDFSIGGTSYTINVLDTFIRSGDRRIMSLGLADARTFPDAVRTALRLHWCSDSSGLQFLNPLYTVVDDNDADWSIHTTREVALSLPANNDATGTPTVAGTAQAGETLTAGMGDIADSDGLPATFPDDYALQWVRVDADGTSNATDIANATANAYTLTAADVGKRVRVRVSFFDVLGGDEEILGALSGEVVSADTTPPTLTSATVSADGSVILLQFSEPVARTAAALPQASDFTIAADGIVHSISEIADPGQADQIAVALDIGIYQGQTVVVTYTDPNAGNDVRAIQDTAGNDAANFTTGMDGVSAVTNNSEIAAVAPGAPTSLTATASGTDTIMLSWTAPADYGGSVITGYKIEVSSDSGTTWTDLVANTAGTATSYDHTGLAASTTRHYRVSAINSIGTGTTASDVASATSAITGETIVRPLAAPPNLTVESHGWKRARLRWDLPPGTTQSDIVRWEYRSTITLFSDGPVPPLPGGVQHTWNWTPLTLDTPGQRTALVTGLENTSTHFQVRAVNRGGTGAPATVWGHNVGAGGGGGFIHPVEGYFRENNRRVLWWARFPHDLDEQTGTVAGFIKDDPELSNLNSISWSWTADAGADLTLGGVAHTVTGVSTTASSDGTQLQLRIKPEVPTGSQAALKAALRLYYGSWSLEGSAAQVASGGGVTTFTWTNDVQDFTLLGRPGSKSSGNQDTIGLALSVPSNFTGQQVEVDPPSIDDTPDVSGAGGDAQWSEGETVGVTVTFSEAVDVDTTNGTPSIGLGLGGPTEARSATYASGSGTAELVFEYTLGSGDGTHSFMAVTPDSLALNGGTIRSTSSGVAAVLAHNGTLVQGRASPALSVADASVDEAPGATLAFVVTLDPASATAVTVDYATTDGTATAGDDYTATSGTLTFAATETTKTIAVPVLDDTHEDSGETLTLTLSNAVNARIEDGTATGTINNDEAGLTAQFTQAPPVHDGSNTFLLHLEFSHAPKGYSYRTVRDDLFAVDGGAIRKARRLVKRRHQQWEITVAPDGDGAVRLEAVATLDCTATYAACDADGRKFDGALRLTVPGPATPPALSSASVDGTALTLTFDKALNGGATPPASAFAVTVAGGARTVASVAVSGSAVTLTLASAVTTGETVTVSYTASTGNAAASFADQAVTNGTAANETPAIPVVSVAASTTPVTEGTAAAFTLSRTGATDAALTVTVEVTESGTVLDATPPSSVTFGAGSGTATLSVPTVDDDTVEAASTVTVTVSAGAGYAVAPDAGTAEGVVESEDVEPLTARWTQVPSEHDGSSPFWLHFAFSHNPTSYSYKTVHQQLFDVTGGRITKAHRAAPPSSIGWEIRIEPDGLGAVTLAARATTDCAAPSAACDVDGRQVRRRPADDGAGPPHAGGGGRGGRGGRGGDPRLRRDAVPGGCGDGDGRLCDR